MTFEVASVSRMEMKTRSVEAALNPIVKQIRNMTNIDPTTSGTSNRAIVIYSVTQSYANSFWGDVVLDTFNNVSRKEDNIKDQIYKANMPGFLLWWFLIFITLNYH